MLYAALTFWLLVIVFVAYGIYQLWAGIVKPKVINIVLLPGTLVAQLGHVIGLLVTGGTINNTTLIKDDETGEPSTTPPAKSRIPFLGPILVALLPMLACGFSNYVVVDLIGQEVLEVSGAQTVSESLPTNLTAFWELLRGSITVAEQVTEAVWISDFHQWQTWLFVYLVICLTVRMAPLPGTQRGAVGAILLTGLVIAVLGLLVQWPEGSIQGMWAVLSFAVATLLILLIATLIVRAVVGLVRILAQQS